MGEISCKIKVNNVDEFRAELARATDTLLEAVGAFLEGEAKLALEAHPRRIDTGLLRNSITYALSGEPPHTKTYHATYSNERQKKGKNAGKRRKFGTRTNSTFNVGYYSGNAPLDPDGKKAVYIGTNVFYAPYIHEGVTRPGVSILPNRFLKNAVEWNKDQLERYVIKELRSISFLKS